MVISLSNGEIQEELNIPFPYQTKSKACFLVGRATTFKDTRSVYTTDSIYYKPLGTKSQDGSWIPDNVTTSHLRYFLQLFFRKEDFRPGQLPILDRALSNLPVIGLLPTGGGKSLTYQIAGLLQPGITMIIDPLKSLMRDQYEGLLKNGIDSTTFINSSVDTDERRRRELALESASIQFVFLSPERLAITNFRERLSEMYNRYAYFSYGVIDEVHCVSEWGHDFRFSYLHLGRNLYQHARAKSGNISLFGLTATASFDVLADVERELSGSGAFDLDQDTIVRYENATRLELQYRIERVSILFERDTYFTSPDPLWSDFPSPVKVEKHFTGYNTKQSHLVNYLQQLPRYYRTLITEEAMQVIKQRFAERQNFPMNQEISLKPKHLIDHSKQEVSYESAGIIFCPHIKNTGISVIEIARTIQTKLQLARISTFHGKLDDDKAENNLDDFSNNRSPIMVATKAFGMGIDKPNVRFTVNMNHSSSLEAFVQEAGRAGRDQKMALSTILFSDYKLVLIRRSCKSIPPHLNIIKNKWFYRGDMASIFEKYNLNVSKEDILVATPQQDAVKLYCQQDNKMFAFKECSEQCSLFKRCELKNASDNARGWMRESELIQQLEIENIALNRNYFKYLNPDFEGNMYFFNNSFKGEIFEKIYMHRLLKIIPVQYEHLPVESIGFLPTLIDLEEGHFTHVHIPYIEDADIPKNELRNTKHNSYSNLSKAIYRMTCIGLVEDFTQDYHAKKFRIGVRRKKEGAYFEALEEFLKRYFSAERAKKQLVAVKQIAVQSENNALQKEIYQCLSFLTHFVYDKISEKRKRAIDDIRNFCLDGLNAPDWLTANEQLKDYIYYYFNSKYARRDYTAQNGEPFSLIEDTDEGKIAPPEVLFKYLRIVDDSDPAVTSETPVDNIKHLLGAIRLISRSLTDSNPTLTLLEAFCIAYLNPVSNQDLLDSIERNYVAGLRDFFNRMEDQDEFWQLFHDYNSHIQTVWQDAKFESLSAGMELVLHLDKFNQIKSKYLN